jgi:hypothetical protein
VGIGGRHYLGDATEIDPVGIPPCLYLEICPHGRPIVKHLTLADLLREFGRI